MPHFIVCAFDMNGNQVLGNLDGQRSWHGKAHQRTKWYKKLATHKTLRNRVKYYDIVRDDIVIETVPNTTFVPPSRTEKCRRLERTYQKLITFQL